MEHESKRDAVYKVLKRQICSGYLPPGSRLIEMDLAARYRTSRTTLREVIKQLAGEGLVELVPFKGAAVARMSAKDIEDLYKIQQDLEGLAAYLATQRMGEQQMDELLRIHQIANRHTTKDVQQWQRWNTRFHKVFLEHCGNKRLLKLVENHRDQFARYWFIVLSIPGCIQENMIEHERIIQAVRARKPILVRYLMEKHIGGGAKRLLQILRNADLASLSL